MLPVAKFPSYRISFDEKTRLAYLTFEAMYEGKNESPTIIISDGMLHDYLAAGHENFLSTVKRINEDYRVGRFARDNPRILMDYELATPDIISQIDHCFSSQMTLIEQEACRLLFQNISEFSSSAARFIMSVMEQGRRVPIEIFCLVFRFYENDQPLVDDHGNLLIGIAHPAEAVNALRKNLAVHCRDAAYIALEVLISNGRSSDNILALISSGETQYHGSINYKNRLRHYSIKLLDLTYESHHFFEMKKLIKQFKEEFPKCAVAAYAEDYGYIKSWLFVEQALPWERDCLACLMQCFQEADIELDLREVGDLLHLPSGRDADWHGYSIGQGIKYLYQYPEDFTKETVSKPKVPFAGRERFVASVWLHYFRFFKPKCQIDYQAVEAILKRFVQRWNGDSLV